MILDLTLGDEILYLHHKTILSDTTLLIFK